MKLKMMNLLQTLSEVEDSLREFEQRVTELKTRAEGIHSDQISNQDLLKLQVVSILLFSLFSFLWSPRS